MESSAEADLAVMHQTPCSHLPTRYPPGRVGIPRRIHQRRQGAGLPFSGVSARALTILMYPPISRVGRTGTVTRSYGVSVKTRVSAAEMWYTVVRVPNPHDP